MSGVDARTPGFCTKGVRAKASSEKEIDTDRLISENGELSYSLGKQGTTRKELGGAAGAFLEYARRVALIAGTVRERGRCRVLFDWLLRSAGAVLPSPTCPSATRRWRCTSREI